MILWINSSWQKSKTTQHYNNHTSDGASVVIAARNEEDFIQKCLLSILHDIANRPNIEIIVVDDNSTDSTVEKIYALKNPLIRVLKLSESKGKKAALTLALNHVNYPNVLFTDADCEVSQGWIDTMVNELDIQKYKLCTGVVLPQISENYLSRIQWLDIAATMALTATGIVKKRFFLANGANMIIKKSVFEEVNGFEGNTHFASGDDVFMIQKVACQDSSKVHFIKSSSSIVRTKAETKWTDIFQQRKRWATKSFGYANKNLIFIQACIFGFHVILIVGGLISLFYFKVFIVWASVLLTKFIVDYIFLNNLAVYFSDQKALKGFIVSFFCYFCIILISGYFALVPSGYLWKDRILK